jgi:hypothetical protein
MVNPQELNRYTYALNNPLKYVDPEGNQQEAVLALLPALALIPGAGEVILIGVAAVGTAYIVIRVYNAIKSNEQDKDEADNKNKNEPEVTRGKGDAPDKAEPNSDYEKIDDKGNVRSHTHYDQNGNKDYREDWDHPHGDIDGPHRHDYLYNEKGQQIASPETTELDPK